MARYAMVIDLDTCTGCRACQAACAMENKTPYWEGKFRTHVEDVSQGEFPEVERKFIPRLCMQCDHPSCVEACPTGASHTNRGGTVVVDVERCILCEYCVSACPYGARYEYTEADRARAKEVFGEAPRNAYIDKCNFCEQRLAAGLEPACASTCLAGARIFGDLDDPASQVSQLVANGKAVVLAPEAGTQPKVYYASKQGLGADGLVVQGSVHTLTEVRKAGQTIGSAGLGLVTVGALGVFGFARRNASRHLAEVSVEAEPESGKEEE